MQYNEVQQAEEGEGEAEAVLWAAAEEL